MDIYKISSGFPKEAVYDLAARDRRSAFSVPANIAERCEKGSDKDFAQYLSIALGFLNETYYFMFLSKDLNLVDKKDFT